MPRTRSATTARNSPDPALRARVYAIPFEDVWQGTLRLVREKLRGWSLLHADDQDGLVQAAVSARLKSFHGTVDIRITLDPDAQTRVDALSITPEAFHDFGANARRLRRFLAALDREAAREHQRRRTSTLAVG